VEPWRGVKVWWAGHSGRTPLGHRAGGVGVAVVALGVAALVLGRALQPFWQDPGLYGAHDWDAHSAYRYITVLSLTRYGEAPWWHPYFCGGFPAWGYSEGATNLVSPFLPAYLLLPFGMALRLEIMGSLLLGFASTWLLARRYTRSHAVALMVAFVFALNGRMALQITAGHTWHMQYAWLPLCLYFMDRALTDGGARFAAWAGATMAMMVYQGGIYPLPHAALILGVWALLAAVAQRRVAPLVMLTAAAAVAVGLAAPKLLAVGDLMQRFPRKIDSQESVDLGLLLNMFTTRFQSFEVAGAPTSPWGWHEYGIYTGVAGVGAMMVGLVFATGNRGGTMKILAALFLLLGLGAFHPLAPWPWLHTQPLFSSQRVPSRFLLPLVLLAMLAFAHVIHRTLERRRLLPPLVDLALLLPVALLGMDLANVGRLSTEHIFNREAPAVEWRSAFHHAERPTNNYNNPDWAGALLLSMYANEGMLRCYGIPDVGTPGALAHDAPGFAGEAYLTEGSATARVVDWSPNRAVVEFSGATPGSLLVYNMNWDPSWLAQDGPALEHKRAVATRVTTAQGRVEFRYRPRTLGVSLFILVFTLLLWAALARGARVTVDRHVPARV
jgi:hypothetical protein